MAVSQAQKILTEGLNHISINIC